MSEKKDEVRNRKSRRTVKQMAGVISVLVAAGVMLQMAPPQFSSRPRVVNAVLPHRAGLLQVGTYLQAKGVVRNRYAFALFAHLAGGIHTAWAGRRYRFTTAMGLPAVVSILQQGGETAPTGIKVTIPEGFTLRQIADRLGKLKITDEKKFFASARNPDIIVKLNADFPLPAHSLEGYLFPDTYYFRPNTPILELLQTMTADFDARFARPYRQGIASSGQSMSTLVTIASLVEREAEVPQDRARIAGVIENRLKRHMRLEVDATVIYAMGRHKTRLTYQDLKTRSLYNTYRHAGLPPGPIACPGLPSLLAALHPEKNDYLYYVAGPGGAHLFARTFAGHEANIRKVRQMEKKEGVQ